jgi:hypothetical protein
MQREELRTDFVDPKHTDSELNRKQFTRTKSESSYRHRSYSGSSARSNSHSLERSSPSKSVDSSGGRGRGKGHKETGRPVKRHAASSDGDHSSPDRRDLKPVKRQKYRAASEASSVSAGQRKSKS